MKDYLQRQRIAALYHFTDIDNLPFILQSGGLRSKEWLEHNGLLARIKTGGNRLSKDLDLRYGNWDKVSLSFCHDHPMAYHRDAKQHLCYAVIKLDVALGKGVQFTDRNAADSNQQRGNGIQGLNLVDFNAVRASFPYRDEQKKRKQAEALVHDFVPLSDFHGFGFRSESSLKEAERLCSAWAHPPLKVKEDFFRLDYSHVKTHVLTAEVVTRENARTINFRDQRIFRVKRNWRLTLLINAYVITGTNGIIRWSDSAGAIFYEDKDTFSQSAMFAWWPSLNASQLSPGSYEVSCYLGDVRQFTLPFQVVS